MIYFEQTNRPPAQLRTAYLNGLLEPQELYLETLVEAGQTWCVPDIAYAVQFDGKLVEFHVATDHSHRVVELFNAAMIASGSTSVLCKSYDTRMLYGALSRSSSVYPTGLLFRRIVDSAHAPRDDVVIRQGRPDDANTIIAFNDDFFHSLDEIKEYAVNDGLFVLENEDATIGCGVAKPVVKNRPDIDIGMLVDSEHRRNGYGSHIVSFLKNHYLNQGMRPICGCSIENSGSQRALSHAGFLSEHRLLNISY